MALDSFTYVISIVLIFLGVQYKLDWLIFGIAAILIITTPSVKTIAIVGLSVIVALYLQSTGFRELWPFVMIALAIVAYFFGVRPEQQQQGGMPPEFAGMQGMEGFGGGPGEFGG